MGGRREHLPTCVGRRRRPSHARPRGGRRARPCRRVVPDMGVGGRPHRALRTAGRVLRPRRGGRRRSARRPAATSRTFRPATIPWLGSREDMLLVPVTAADGMRLGLLSLDLPRHGLRPDDDELDVLVAIGAHIGVALEQVQLSEAVERRERVQDALTDLVADMVSDRSGRDAPRGAGRASTSTLGYERVVLDLVDPVPARCACTPRSGCPDEARALLLPTGSALLDAVVDESARGSASGSSTSPRATRCSGPSGQSSGGRRPTASASRRGGTICSPCRSTAVARAHPVVRAAAWSGVIWVQDPTDRLLPSAGRLRALRAYAGLAGLALAGR